jgi:branched-chain amino acid transport system substrate-binding protein
MKRIVFLVIAALLVTGLVLPGCGGDGGDGGNGGPDTRPSITLAIADAMTDVTGEFAIAGAEIARDEINDGAGVNVGGTYYKIALVEVDTNEVSGTPDQGVTALESVIDDVDIVLGGFRTEQVTVYREVAMDAQKLFFNCGAATGALQYSVVQDYDRYKYWFKSTPYNEAFLATSLFKIVGTFTAQLRAALLAEGDAVIEDYKVTEDSPMKVAIIAEDAAWCAGLVAILAGKVTTLGYTLAGVWKVSPIATSITNELTDIASKHPHLIMPVFSGPVGSVYMIQKVGLGIPALTIGINVPDQVKSAWANSDGKINGEILLDTWADGLQNTAKTTAFLNAFMTKTGEYPSYTAATYDTILSLKVAIEAVSAANDWDDIADVIDPANIDALIQYLEDPSHAYTGTASRTTWYPMPAINEGGGTYALSAAQVGALYDLASYGKTYSQAQWKIGSTAMMGAHIAHDTVYGPGWQTGIGSQWQDGKKVGVWPTDLGDAYDAALTDQYGCWNMEYPGTKDVVIEVEGFLAS